MDIFRTYFSNVSNVSEGSRIIINYLFSKKKSVSKRTARDAKLLTEFFSELKALSENNLADTAEMMILGTEIKNMPVLNFALGGNAMNQKVEGSGGLLFEEEIGKLFIESGREIKGTSSATSYLDLGPQSKKGLEELIQNIANEETGDTIEVLKKKISKLRNNHYYLKIGAKRAGKIDKQGNTISFDIGLEPTSKMKRAKKLLEESTFSIKSYETMGTIHLGDTVPQKAVSAVADYVNRSQHGQAKINVRGAAIYYNRHPNQGNPELLFEQRNEEVELYRRYKIMKNVYELTGIGLRYDEIEGLYSVDFLLVNRSQSSDITVYSTQDLINRYDINAEKLGSFDIK